jgi:hypothetical protein
MYLGDPPHQVYGHAPAVDGHLVWTSGVGYGEGGSPPRLGRR